MRLSTDHISLSICAIIIFSSCSKEHDKKTFLLTELNYRTETELKDSSQVVLETVEGDKYFDYSILYLEDSIEYRFKISGEDENYAFKSQRFTVDGDEYILTRIDNEKTATMDGRAFYYFLGDRLFAISSRDWPNFSFYLDESKGSPDRHLMNLFITDNTGFFELPAISEPEPPPVEQVVDSLLQLDPDNPNFPSWVRALFKDTSRVDSITTVVLLAWQQLNDSIGFGVLELQDSMCSTLAVSIIKNKKKINRIPLGKNCDMDSAPAYSIWTEYEILKNGTIRVIEYRECFATKDSTGNLPCTPGIDSSLRIFMIHEDGEYLRRS